jgi:DNA-binding NarL/FixJ family response regulator
MPYIRPINLLIVDDHQLITDGLSQILKNEKSIGEIHTASNGQIAFEQVLSLDIDCVIMDINMPVLSGLESTKLIKKEKPVIKIIIVSMLCDATIVGSMLKAGVDAFINKDTGKNELLKALASVMQGEKYISSQISSHLLNKPNSRSQVSDPEKQLTSREVEIIRLIADGLTNREIAEKLFLSSTTVDTHRKNMLAKLALRNTASLVKYASDHKLLQ